MRRANSEPQPAASNAALGESGPQPAPGHEIWLSWRAQRFTVSSLSPRTDTVMMDTLASILDTIWTGLVIAFLLLLPTFFLKGAEHARTGSIPARPYRRDSRRQRPSCTEGCCLQS